jgi:hypothetical protein
LTKTVNEYLNEFLNEDPTRDAAHRVLARMGRDWTGAQQQEAPTKPPKVDPEREKEKAERRAKAEAELAVKKAQSETSHHQPA